MLIHAAIRSMRPAFASYEHATASLRTTRHSAAQTFRACTHPSPLTFMMAWLQPPSLSSCSWRAGNQRVSRAPCRRHLSARQTHRPSVNVSTTGPTFGTCPPKFQHAADMARLDAEDHSAGWSEQVFLDDMASPLSRCLVMHQTDDTGQEGPVVGFACLRVVAGEAELQNMAVSRQHRGQGLGKRLLLALLELGGCMEPEGGAPCHLEVKAHNHPAIALYKACSFQEVGLRKRFYPDGSDAVLMTRPPGRQ